MEGKINTLLELEEQFQFEEFTSNDALELGLIIINIAKEEIKKGVAIHIEYDDYPLFTHYMEGTSSDNTYWLAAKKNVVKKFEHSSLYMGLLYKSLGTTFHKATELSDAEFQAEGGSFPLFVKGKGRVGSVTVSNLTGEEDHSLAVEGIRRYLSIRKSRSYCWTTIHVNNLEESLAFYENIVGLSINRRFISPTGNEIAFLGDGETRIELIYNKTAGDIRIGQDISLGFNVNSVTEMIEYIKSKGLEPFSEIMKPNPHIQFFYILDPNGVKIQFVEHNS